MKKNMGGIDRIIRFAVAIGVGVLYYFGILSGTIAYVLLTLALVFLLTTFVSFCPLYSLFGLSTCKVKNR